MSTLLSNDLLRKAAKLAVLENRGPASRDLARVLGGTDLLFFVRDLEIPTFVAAPGFRSSVPSGKLWNDFLSQCVQRGEHTASLPFSSPTSTEIVTGIAPVGDAVLVIVGVDSIAGNEWVRELIPLYTAMFHGEQAAMVASANARLAADAASRNVAMTEVLTQSRKELEEALAVAESARAAAEAANRVKSDFLATMSHELRTPLNAIGGYSQLLAMGIHGPVNKEQRETLERIDRSQRHLLGLINDILNLARLESGKVEYQIASLDVADVVRDLTPMLGPQLVAKNIQHIIDIPAGICVSADRDKLQQILLNILSNAIKFTEAGGTIRVSAAHHTGHGAVEISISDTGIGIPPEKLQMVFEPFIQVDASHSRLEQGAGLGLAISRDLARGMGGDISATSELGRGSTFMVTLPPAV